jgi:predicted Zn-dependent protease
MGRYTPKNLEQNVNVSDPFPVMELIRLLLISLVVISVFYVGLGFAVDWVIPNIPPSVEPTVFKTYVQEFDALPEDSRSGPIARKIVQRLEQHLPNSQYAFNVKVVDDDAVNAVAFPGGNIVVFTGLLREVRSEEELAFILSHEIGHITHRDHLRSMGRVMVFIAFSNIILGPDNTLNKFISKSIKLSELQFSKQQESQADSFGLDLMNKTYHHVGGGISFFERVLLDGEKSNWVLNILSTHPATGERIEMMRREAAARHYQL